MVHTGRMGSAQEYNFRSWRMTALLGASAANLPHGTEWQDVSDATRFILYVADQARSASFYTAALGQSPRLDVPGMTEFDLPGGGILGLMPEFGILKLLGERLPDPAEARGVPRSELYLTHPDADACHARALRAGATELSQMLPRDWGDHAAYSLDLDGHVLAFARLGSPGARPRSQVLQLDHVQLAMPAGQEAAARGFFVELLGMREEPKPAALASRGGCWFRSGQVSLHLGVEAEFRPQRKAHPALRVSDLDALARTLERAGHGLTWDDLIPGVRRFYAHDPFGNRIEFMEEPIEPTSYHEQAPLHEASAAGGVVIRNLLPSDYRTVISVVDDWWGRPMRHLLPYVFLEHFGPTSFAVDGAAGLRAFLVGFVSQSDQTVGYIHFIGVEPASRASGLARTLYERFFETAKALGCNEVRSVTSPSNTASIAFHTRMGFEALPGDSDVDGLPIVLDHGGTGQSRVRFRRSL